MKQSLNNKMLGLGLLVFISIGVMIGLAQYSSSNITSLMEKSKEANLMLNKRHAQLALLNKYEYSMIQLTLTAMDSIIDKEEGKVSDERLENIKNREEFLKGNMNNIVAIADTEEEKQMAREVGDNINHFINAIKVDLVTAITQSARRINEIEQDFVRIDDVLDEFGDGFREKLEAVLGRQQEMRKESGSAQQAAFLASSMKLQLVQVQQWLTDISATRGMQGFDDGFDNAEQAALAFKKDLKALLEVESQLKEQFAGLEKSFDAFYEKGKWMANQYIQFGPEEGNKAMSEFDAFASDIGDRIQKLIDVTTAQAAKLHEVNEGIDLIEGMLKSHISLMLAAMDSIIDKDEGSISEDRMNEIKETVSVLKSGIGSLKQYEGLGFSPAEYEALANDFAKLTEGITVDLKNLIEKSAVEQKQIEELFVKFDDDLDASAGAIEEALQNFRVSVEGEVKEAETTLSEIEEGIKKDLERNQYFTWAFSIIIIAVISVLFFFFTRSITRPIRRIIEGLNSGADQVSFASGQVSTSSQSLAEGTSQQAASIEETSSSLEEMSSMTRKNAENAAQADNLMKEATVVVGNAGKSMETLTASMTEISKASEETQKIIKTIDEIAFQTNLLALNAAVEAARAGEAGAGFAVVADEVRNLAMRAAEAAKNTAELIEGTVRKISAGTVIVYETSESFTAVSSASEKIAGLVNEITGAFKEQSHGIEQINSAIGEFDQVTQQNAASAEESAAASEEMRAQAMEMKAMVDDLVGLIEGRTMRVKSTSAIEPPERMRTEKLNSQDRRKPKEIAKGKDEMAPQQAIPFDDEEGFKDF